MTEPTDREALRAIESAINTACEEWQAGACHEPGCGCLTEYVRPKVMPPILAWGNEREAAAMESVFGWLAQHAEEGWLDEPVPNAIEEMRKLSPLPDYAERLRLEGAIAEAKWRLQDNWANLTIMERLDELEARHREIVEKSKAREAK